MNHVLGLLAIWIFGFGCGALVRGIVADRQRPREWLAKSMGPVPPEVAAALRVLERYNVKWPNDASVKHVD